MQKLRGVCKKERAEARGYVARHVIQPKNITHYNYKSMIVIERERGGGGGEGETYRERDIK